MLHPPRGGNGIGDYSLRDFAAKWMMQQDDIAEIDHFVTANAALRAQPADDDRPVVIGDSITAFWTDLPHHLPRPASCINRGIAGQNTSQMLLRFQDDVVALAPRTVLILGGINDLRCYAGDPAGIADTATARIIRNISSMVDIALARKIVPLVGALPPVGRDRSRILRDPATILRVNARLRALAIKRACGFVDFHSALTDPEGFIDATFSDDGVHPNSDGYRAMAAPLIHAVRALEHS